MTVMWSTCSFGGHLLNFMNKYLEGSIFTNNYYEGIAGGFSTIFGAKLYSTFGMRTSFILSFSLALVGGTVVYLLESGSIDLPVFFLNQFDGHAKHQKYLAINYLVPKFMLLAKLGV